MLKSDLVTGGVTVCPTVYCMNLITTVGRYLCVMCILVYFISVYIVCSVCLSAVWRINVFIFEQESPAGLRVAQPCRYYAPPRGHYAVIGVRRPSVCLSVRLYVRPSARPSV